MNVSLLIKKASSSLIGHVVLFQIFWGVPMAFLGIWLNYDERTLTFPWALWCIFLASIGALFVAAGFWFTFSRPLIRKRQRREDI